VPHEALKAKFDEKAIDAIFAGLDQCHLPGAAVGIAINGKPVYRKGFGLANMELPLTLSPSTKLRIASTTKHFTCFAYVLLCEAGRARVDDPVAKYFPEMPSWAGRVTMRQLMSNTSGLHDVYDIFNQFNEPYLHSAGAAQRVSSVDLLSLYREMDDTNAPPNSNWIYNNGGWLLLSVAIERITGQTLEQVLHECVFEPVGMFDTALLRSDTTFVPNRGSQHVVNPAGGFERMYWGVENFLGAGAVISTIDDMLKWLKHMASPSIGTAESWSLMLAPQRLTTGCEARYGFGLMIDNYRGALTVHHAGNALGGNAQMLKVPSVGLDVVVLVNRQDVWGFELVKRVLDVCLEGLDPPPESCVRPSIAGIFRSPSTNRVVELFDKEGQQWARMGVAELPMECAPDGALSYAQIWDENAVKIRPVGDNRTPDTIVLSEFGNDDELRLEAAVSSAETSAIVGRYRAQRSRIEAQIVVADGLCRLMTAGGVGAVTYELKPIGERLWRTQFAGQSRIGFLGGVLCFAKDHGSFTFSSYLTRGFRFDRDS